MSPGAASAGNKMAVQHAVQPAIADLVDAVLKARPGGQPHIHGSHVEVWWDGGWPDGHVLRFDTLNDRLHFSFLSTTCHPRPQDREQDAGTYRALCEHLVPAAREQGITVLTTSPFDPESERLLCEIGGFEPDETGGLTWRI